MKPNPELSGVTVVVTRPVSGAAPLLEQLQAAGAGAHCIPLIDFAPPLDPGPLMQACRQIARYDWIVFTSRQAVRAVVDQCPLPAVNRPAIAAMGPGTADRLEAAGWPVDLVARGLGGAGLARLLSATHDLVGRRVLFPASSLAATELTDVLGTAGAQVERVEAYRTVPPPPERTRDLLPMVARATTILVLASPSAVQNFLAMCRNAGGEMRVPLAEVKAVAIGATTGRELREAGVSRVEEATTPDSEGLFNAVSRLWQRMKSGAIKDGKQGD